MEDLVNFDGYVFSLLDGSLLTMGVALSSLVLSLGLGLLAALAKLSNHLTLRMLGTMYTGIVRGIPDLVLLLLSFFGGQILVNSMGEYFGYDGYINIDPFVAGILSIGFIYGAYMGETLRGAILAIDRGQIEAGTAVGMSPMQVNYRIIFPQMLRHALPGIGNNWLVLLKGTAIVSIIGLEDLVRKGTLASGSTQQPFKFYLLIALIFLAFTTVSLVILAAAERKFSLGFRDFKHV